jgi:hypothetical protein
MKKLYIVAATLFVLAFIILGVATSFVLSGPEQPSSPPAAAANPGARGASAPSPHAGNAPRGAGELAAPGPFSTSISPSQTAPRAANTLPGLPGTPGITLNTGLPAAPNTPLGPSFPGPPPPPIQQGPPVPIIQPTDIGSPSSPTAGRTRP